MPRPAAISPDLMSTFVTVVHTEGDATTAAELLGINQPSMSKRLAFLQHAGRILRKPWLERVGKSWRLTAEGRRILPAVEELVHRYRLLTESIEESRPEVVIGCGTTGAAGFVREALGVFQAHRPEGTFRISTLPASSRVEGVGNGSLDLACIRLEPHELATLAHRRLYVADLFTDPLVLAAIPRVKGFEDFQELTEKGVTPKSIVRFPLVLPEPGSGLRRDFDRRCRETGIIDRLNIVAEVGPSASALAYVLAGVGVGVLPRSVAVGQAELYVKPLPAKLMPGTTVRVICRRQSGTDALDLSDGAKVFLQSLQAMAQTMGQRMSNQSQAAVG